MIDNAEDLAALLQGMARAEIALAEPDLEDWELDEKARWAPDEIVGKIICDAVAGWVREKYGDE